MLAVKETIDEDSLQKHERTVLCCSARCSRNTLYHNLSKDDRVICNLYIHLRDPAEIADRYDTYIMQIRMDGKPAPTTNQFSIKATVKRIQEQTEAGNESEMELITQTLATSGDSKKSTKTSFVANKSQLILRNLLTYHMIAPANTLEVEVEVGVEVGEEEIIVKKIPIRTVYVHTVINKAI